MNYSPGLTIVLTRGSSLYRGLVRIGWLRHVAEDLYALHGARVLVRSAGWNTANGYKSLAEAAANGSEGWELLPASEFPEEILQEHLTRPVRCNPKKWAKECPRPKDWAD